MADDIHQVELVFDDETGELKDVRPIGKGVREKVRGSKDPIDISHLQKKGLQKITLHSLLYSSGSPGCVTYRTAYGYITICWP